MTGFSKHSSSSSSSSSNNTSTTTWIVPALLASGVSIATLVCGYWAVRQHEKYLRSRWLEEEEQKEIIINARIAERSDDFDGKDIGDRRQSDSLFSVIEHFKSLELSSQSTIFEANRRRTTSYYEKMREGHQQSLVLGTPKYSLLLKKRQDEMDRLLLHYKAGNQSLRTVIVMLDQCTQQVLSEARQKILQPLNYSWDIYNKGVWIPEINIIPKQDMHVSVACPWWWHTIREGNHELNNALAKRLRQTLVIDFHHPFSLELERIILLGGKTLVALWRTVGERTTSEDAIVCDRHAKTIDPMVRLRREIVDCFTNEEHEHNFEPLTHHHRKKSYDDGKGEETTTSTATSSKVPPPLPPPLPPRQKMQRRHTIEMKTPGIGTGDGFIHTTLCRLPLDCFSTDDVELEPIHRLCREATATYAGHRMFVHKFRFVEMTGEGGDSNPCTNPLFDETMAAPRKVVPRGGPRGRGSEAMKRGVDGFGSNAERNAHTTGRTHNLTLNGIAEASSTTTVATPGGIEGLFVPPSS